MQSDISIYVIILRLFEGGFDELIDLVSFMVDPNGVGFVRVTCSY